MQPAERAFFFMEITKNGNNSGVAPLKKSADPKWFAAYTNPRAEKQVRDRLIDAGVEVFLPLQKTYRIWSDRKKLIEVPLLSSYVFVKVSPKELLRVYQVSGIVRIVTFEGQPAAIPQNQIDNLRLLIDSNTEIEVTSEKYEKGDNVEVVRGALAGLTGELIKTGNHSRVVVRIDTLDQNLIVNIPMTFLRRL